MKTIERITNPYFQDIDFAKVLKGKHVDRILMNQIMSLKMLNGLAVKKYTMMVGVTGRR